MENTYAAKIETTCTEWGSSEPAHYGLEISPSNGYKRILLLMVIDIFQLHPTLRFVRQRRLTLDFI